MRRIDEIIVHCTASPEGQEMTVKQIDNIHRNERHWADGRFIEIRLSQAFLEYGLWQDFGMGKEISRSNNGDIGREKKRVTKKCFSKKYYSSVLNLRDFLADKIGQSFVGLVAKSPSRSMTNIEGITTNKKRGHYASFSLV